MAYVVFESHLGEVQAALQEQVERAAEIIGGMAESYAKDLARVDTGNMRNSISHSVEDGGHTVAVGAGAEYAIYNEMGTGRYASGGGGRQTPWRYQDGNGNWRTTYGMTPQPFIRPSIENHVSEYKKVFETELKS